jgi:recombination protein RecT
MRLVNGFEKAIAWEHDRVKEHAQRFSKSYNAASSPWKTDFEAMALKTMLLQLIPKYGPMTIEMSTAISHDSRDQHDFEYDAESQANQDIIDIDQEPEPDHVPDAGEMTEEEKAEIAAQAMAEAQENVNTDGPGF